jgi:hypothetical protein
MTLPAALFDRHRHGNKHILPDQCLEGAGEPAFVGDRMTTRSPRRSAYSRAATLASAAPFGRLLTSMSVGKIYNERGPNPASIIRLASATISSVLLFSKLEGLSANARVKRDLESQSFVRRSVGDFRAVMHFGCPSILHQANAWLLLMGHPLDNSRSSA